MSTNFLFDIVAQKRAVLGRSKDDVAANHTRERALDIRKTAVPHRLLHALKSPSPRLKIIAEFKRRSPSAGLIRSDLSAAEVARHYERGGACAISVLTDEMYFGGSILDLGAVRASTALPILRKDFIIDPIQIYETAINGGDAVLLIVAALDDELLAELRNVAEEQLGLDALVEVHSSEELRRAIAAGASIIGVNNRNLRTLQVSLETSERLIAEAPRDKIMVSESGLQTVESLHHLHKLGFHGFLIGEALMRSSDPEAAVRDLIGSAHFQRALPLQIKICGVTNAQDARVCVELGANLIGLNFYPQSPRYIEPKVARQIVEALPVNAGAVGVFVNENADAIREKTSAAGLRCIQLHGNSSPELVRDLANEFRVIRVFSTHERFRPEDVSLFSYCDVLIDAHHPDLHGGTGRTCDWEAARATLRFTRFLILSGGLNGANVARAIKAVTPHAVDVCSGVESAPGVKDHRLIKLFLAAVRKADHSARASVPD